MNCSCRGDTFALLFVIINEILENLMEKSTESIEGDASIGDRVNMAFASCSVTYGRGRGIVVATGTDSEMGKIAAMIESVPEMKTPMQVRLSIGVLIVSELLKLLTNKFSRNGGKR